MAARKKRKMQVQGEYEKGVKVKEKIPSKTGQNATFSIIN